LYFYQLNLNNYQCAILSPNKPRTFTLNQTPCLLLFTDGVIEALEDREGPGEEVLRNLLASNYELSSSDIVEEINKRFIKSETNHDDLILAVLKAD